MGRRLNAAQATAISHMQGPMLVLAGPGSGKTTVITERIARLIQEGVSPSKIMVVTFTRAAAEEMRQRFKQRAGGEVLIGTFHSIFFRMLRASYPIDRRNILPEEERQAILKQFVTKIHAKGIREKDLADEVGREISLLRGSKVNPEYFYPSSLPAEEFQSVLKTYEDWKQSNHRLDFDDIIFRCHQLFTNRPDIVAAWQSRYSYYMIDEFQDISPLQYEIMKMLTEKERNIFIVGDDDQSIYRFRGANPQLMLNFPKEYPEAKQTLLDINYRCPAEVLRTAGKLIGHNRIRFPKKLSAHQTGGEKITFLRAAHLRDQAKKIAELIRARVRNGAAYEDFAVLFRTNFDCRPVIQRFISDQIPFYSAEQLPCIFDHWIAKCILSYLELAAGGRRRSDFLRICNVPNRYLSRNAFLDEEISFWYLYDYYEDKDWMCDRIEQWEQDLKVIGSLSPYASILYLRRTVGLDQYVKEYAAENQIQPEDLIAVLDAVTDSSKEWNDFPSWKQSIAEYKERLEQDRKNAMHVHEKGVLVGTLHSAKGKEYDHVIIPDLNEGVLPYRKAKQEADLEEERRMLYVGMTRAKKTLIMMHVAERFDKKVDPSRFLEEIAE